MINIIYIKIKLATKLATITIKAVHANIFCVFGFMSSPHVNIILYNLSKINIYLKIFIFFNFVNMI